MFMIFLGFFRFQIPVFVPISVNVREFARRATFLTVRKRRDEENRAGDGLFTHFAYPFF